MERHAVLALTHGHPGVFERQLRLLDHRSVDVFVHVDRRTPLEPYAALRGDLAHSELVLLERRRASSWGSHALVDAILDLLEAASGSYDRVHLVSGQDLPLRTGGSFEQYFENRRSMEFVGFAADDRLERLRYYYWLQHRLGPGRRAAFQRRIQSAGVRVQRRCRVDRLRAASFVPKKGSTWFSITRAFADELIRRRRWIESFTRYALLPDEAFVQTTLWNSTFRDALDPSRDGRADSEQGLRAIDWSRPNGASPHTWRVDDAPQLLESDCLFARKFDPYDGDFLDAMVDAVRAREP